MGPLVPAAVSVLLVAGTPAVLAAAKPTVHVASGTATPGGSVAVSGTGCPAGEADEAQIRLVRFGGPHVDDVLRQVAVGADGSFAARVTLPEVPPSDYLVVARCLYVGTTPPTETGNGAVKLQVRMPSPAPTTQRPTPTRTATPTPPPTGTATPTPTPTPTRTASPTRSAVAPVSPAPTPPPPSAAPDSHRSGKTPPGVIAAMAAAVIAVAALAVYVWRRRRQRTGWIF